MPVAQSGSLVMPTGPGSLQDFQVASFTNTNGTVSQRVSQTTIPVYSSSSFQVGTASTNATGTVVIKAGAASKQIYITDIVISAGTIMDVTLLDGATTLIPPLHFPSISIFSKSFNTPGTVSTAGTLQFVASAAGSVSVFVTGYQI